MSDYRYLTVPALELRVGPDMLARLVDDPAMQDTVIDGIIDRAADRIDGYLSGRYTTPVPTSGLIEECALAIAEWELYRRGAGNVPEKIRKAYEDALRDLRDIAQGKMNLGGATEPTSSTSTGGLLISSLSDPMFDGTSMAEVGW